MGIVIDHLFEHPQHVPLVARWIHGAFWAGAGGYSVADLEGLLREACDPARIPLSRLALVDGEPAGTVNLIDCDDLSRSELHPWLAALYVGPSFRGRGVGSILVRQLQRDATVLGYDGMYLGTDAPGFYARLGAQTHELRNTGHVIMRLPSDGG